jgi:uncharacterized membrane protein SpoIIM required for sporulation
MALGILTVYVLVLNGLFFGALFGYAAYYNTAGPLTEFVIGHGVLELSMITMAGGAGLQLGFAILRPGLLARRDAVALAAQTSVRLLLGSAPLLVVAGIIEGLISPSDVIPMWVKVSVGVGTGILLYAYLLLAGRAGAKRTRGILSCLRRRPPSLRI